MTTRHFYLIPPGGAAPLPPFTLLVPPKLGRLLCFLVASLLLTMSCAVTDPYEDEHDEQWVYWMLHRQDWHPWEYGYFYEVVGSIKDASELTNVAPEAIVATLWQESGLRHYKTNGSVKRGDGGAARGAAQVHYSPWTEHFTKELGRDIDLDDLHDNVEVCARLLLRGGWLDNPLTAYGYYNSGQRGYVNNYARSVASIEQNIMIWRNPDGTPTETVE